jgi:hypothetical protein
MPSINLFAAALIVLLSSVGSLSAVLAADRQPGQKGNDRAATAHPMPLSKPVAKPGLKLIQISRNHGEHMVYVSPTSLRVVNVPGHCEFIWSSPESTLWIINTETKCFFSEPLEKWYSQALSSLSIVGSAPTKFNPASYSLTNVKFEGLECHQFNEKALVTGKTVDRLHARTTRVRHTGLGLITLASQNYKIPGRILSLLYNIPMSDELPLSHVNIFKGRAGFELQTKSIVHEPIPSTSPMPPKGFVRSKTLNDALVSGSKKHDFEDLMKEMKVGEDFGTTSKNK